MVDGVWKLIAEIKLPFFEEVYGDLVMFQEIQIDKRKIKISNDPKQDFTNESDVMRENLYITMDIMQNCLDTIYDLAHVSYPGVFKPTLYIANNEFCNACADLAEKKIIINIGLIKNAGKLIKRYTKERLERYHILNGISEEDVQSGVRVNLWRFVVLHELYHLWERHSLWKALNKTSENGEIVRRVSKVSDISQKAEDNVIEEKVYTVFANPSIALDKLKIEQNITQQALEFCADSSAVCMMINLMMMDMDNRKIPHDDQFMYIQTNLAYIMAALSTAFCLFDGNAGANFTCLNNLDKTTHPIPAIRLVYAEEIADGCLEHYIPENEKRFEAEAEWQKMVCDVEADYKGTVDMGQVFFFPAYTEKAQRHICRIKRRMTDMYDSMSPFVVCNRAPKMEEEELAFLPEAVRFDETGKSLCGWRNPATGEEKAIRADKVEKNKPIVKSPKIGRNDPCPCGSGKKYKKCCGK